MIIVVLTACASKQKNPEKWSDEEVNAWFEKQDWLNGWQVQPDASIDKKELAIYYHKNPRHWDQAFNFLKTADLKNLPAGTQELEGKHLFVAISEYDSKEKPDTRYESHKKYIDIQYVIKGEELMGITTLDKVEVDEPYDSEKDLAFYKYEGGDYVKATPENFMIFFPEDVHRPSIKVDENVPVKKGVVKILIE
jgi:YhcH/YjgK/YiaL family protein